MLRSLAGVLIASSLVACDVGAQATEVMVLGTYHFANPGLDLHNATVDDVLSPRRQQEVSEVAAGLAAFRPTKVAVEVVTDAIPDRTLDAYRRYLAGEGAQERNEIFQIGFRLAKQVGLTSVIGVDAKGDFPFEELESFAEAEGRGAELKASIDSIGSRTRKFERRAKTSSVGALLKGLNDPAAIQEDHAWYMKMLSFGRGGDQPAAKLLGSWQARNVEICARLVQAVKPGERVVVVFGAGHSYLLRRCVLDLPGWTLVEPNLFLPD
ncbi:MAG: DUF5694 domain-containing protein [Gammaproteobacteria bacterium]|nr:DUF5694 domain-containing protein [Gammaproteobacteria bacterium]